ncbi:hypothetical protein AX17_005987, partial [Amanita inopinata Kibby_2008]
MLVAERRANKKLNKKLDESIDLDLLEKAFEKPPNYLSSKALELFLVQKCFNEGCKKSVAEQIHMAFCNHWDTMDDDEYAGEYRHDPKTKVIHGCPACAHMIKDLMKNIKNRSHIEGAAAMRNHAEAMLLADLKRIMKWSETACPSMHCESLEGMMLATKHLFMRAFMTTGFTIWTRNFELCTLQYSNLTMDCIGEDGVPYFLVKLENRKGWRSQVGYD